MIAKIFNQPTNFTNITIHSPAHYDITCGDCITNNPIPDNSVDLGIHDPPFGILERSFGKHYNRDSTHVIDGYVEAPVDYYAFSRGWINQAKRVLKPNGSMYILSGWSHSAIIGRVLMELDLFLINKIIWQFPFGVYASKKYVSSHYEIFYVKKSPLAKVIFNKDCRYSTTKEQYADMQSVWSIKKENQPGKIKNSNKLPEALIEKMISYSSNKGDLVCDFFMGNFTTAIVSKRLKRRFVGMEINPNAFVEGHLKFVKTCI